MKDVQQYLKSVPVFQSIYLISAYKSSFSWLRSSRSSDQVIPQGPKNLVLFHLDPQQRDVQGQRQITSVRFFVGDLPELLST